ncbi:MAG: hypothetical protein MJ166_07865 [Clostridia bacterium]|nr:hypothetical protein [Clostridia bacterium]
MKRRLSMLVVLSLALTLFGCDKDNVVKISVEDNSGTVAEEQAPEVEATVQDAEVAVVEETNAVAETDNNTAVVDEATTDSEEITAIEPMATEFDDYAIGDETGDVGDDVLSIMYADYFNLLGSQKCANLYTHISSVENIPSIGGSYNRTNVTSAYSASLSISSVTASGFDYTLSACNGANSGTIVEQAYFVSEVCALSRLQYDNSQYVVFIINNDNITVYSTGSAGDLGLGNGVSVVGEYITGEVTYTNEDAANEYFTEGQLEQLEAFLSADYYQIFVTSTQDGVVTVEEEDGYKIISAFVQGVADTYGYAVVITDGVVVGIEFADGEAFLLPEIGC